MKFVIFGLTVSSSWGNGHATLWRGLIRALAGAGHSVTFFERDVSYYASNRDMHRLCDGAELLFYEDWRTIGAKALREIHAADVAIVTSYCPDARAAARMILDEAPAAKLFYDLDTPVTLSRLNAGEEVAYLPKEGLADFDLVLSYTGGPVLEELRTKLGARRAAPLYGHVDPDWHKPAPREPWYAADLSYLGTYAADRQRTVETLFIEPARRRPDCSFLLGGSAYPAGIEWPANVRHVGHVPPSHHPSFFCSSRLTLNVTRADMASMGWCPSGRLFEAAACGAAILSDWWPGLDEFFEPGAEILVAHDSPAALAALDVAASDLRPTGERARERVLDQHTSAHRANELLELVRSIAPQPEREPEAAEG
jgi:spore maturation protein CgeB